MFGVNDNDNQTAPIDPAAGTQGGPLPNPITTPTEHASHAPTDPAPSASPHDASDSDLLELKQKALNSLTPMVDKLEQTPEEKFKTIMMLIQASDNVGLVKEAYAAAEAIPDERARAQALIDVVNEINYFTQSKQS
jgi:hypothetical protein